MASSCFVILPNHLFDINRVVKTIQSLNSILDTQQAQQQAHTSITDIYVIEEPVYFGDRDITLNFNKLKLVYHRASLTYYYDYLKKNSDKIYTASRNKINIKYINYNELSKKTTSSSSYKTLINQHSNLYMYDPVDTFLEHKYSQLFGKKINYIENPLFLCSNKDLEEYHKSKPSSNSYTHASFYKWQKTRLHILETEKSYDTENRNKMPIETKIPPLPKNDAKNKETRPYLIEAIEYIEKQFPNNLEPIDTKPIQPESIHFPITHKNSIAWLKHFCIHRLENFGEYEDSIDSIPRNFLFHSTISPMLNLGLITPDQVITIVTTYYHKNKHIKLSNYEGFIRQVIGWREYQRYIYKYIGNKMRTSNYFNNDRKLSEHWYKATTTIKPVDDAIKMAINDGYIHHILRLMVIGNFMNLVGIHPDEVYKWFMEFSLDSYDWVMIGNVYSMTLWADGGMTMRKPYISGDGYIMKMGNYKSKGEWNTIWNTVFHHFIDRNTEQLSKTYYNGIVKAWVRKTKNEREKELTIANEFIKRISH
jgi:deoxyribodipyrimidine photolyase-related protein